MPCAKCGHDNVLHRLIVQFPEWTRPCMYKTERACDCKDYVPDGLDATKAGF